MGLPILKNRWLGKCCLVCRRGLVYWCPVDTTAMKSIRCFYPLSSVCSSVNYVKSIIFFGNKKYSSMAPWKLSEPFVLMVTSILFIVYNTVKQHKLTKSALKTDTFTFHVFKKPSFQIHEKLKSVSYCVKTHPLFTWFLIDTKSISAVSRSARLEIDSIHCPWQGVSVAMHKESETEGPKWNAAANLTYTSTLVTCFMKHAFVETYYRFLPTTGWDRSKKTSWFWGDEVGNVM